MAILKGPPQTGRAPTFSGRFMVDTVRGVLRVRRWPKRRGRPISSSQRFWVDWFRQANELAKYASAMDQRMAIEASKFSGFYPRDIILKAMRGRLYNWTDETGFRWYPMAAVTDISEALDVVSQRIGSVLVRAGDRWRDAAPGVIGNVLTHRGEGTPPIWAPGGGGGGVVQEEIPGTPIVFDNTQTFYDLDVSTYSEVQLNLSNTILADGADIGYQWSIDGGLTFKSAAADYFSSRYANTLRQHILLSFMAVTPNLALTPHWHQVTMRNLRIGRATHFGQSSSSSLNGGTIAGAAQFDGPVTHVRLGTFFSTNFVSGDLRAVGTLA